MHTIDGSTDAHKALPPDITNALAQVYSALDHLGQILIAHGIGGARVPAAEVQPTLPFGVTAVAPSAATSTNAEPQYAWLSKEETIKILDAIERARATAPLNQPSVDFLATVRGFAANYPAVRLSVPQYTWLRLLARKAQVEVTQ
jgi:hypothetical protein